MATGGCCGCGCGCCGCCCFRRGRLMHVYVDTFNDEVSCRVPVPGHRGKTPGDPGTREPSTTNNCWPLRAPKKSAESPDWTSKWTESDKCRISGAKKRIRPATKSHQRPQPIPQETTEAPWDVEVRTVRIGDFPTSAPSWTLQPCKILVGSQRPARDEAVPEPEEGAAPKG